MKHQRHQSDPSTQKETVMNSTELGAIRRLLFYTQAEAAELVGCVSERTWQRWESGETQKIPQDVQEKILYLLEWRNDEVTERARIADLTFCQEKRLHALPSILWYPTLDTYIQGKIAGSEMYWRPSQSAAAEMAARGYNVIEVSDRGGES